jgi:hypothetical protein
MQYDCKNTRHYCQLPMQLRQCISILSSFLDSLIINSLPLTGNSFPLTGNFNLTNFLRLFQFHYKFDRFDKQYYISNFY